MKSKYEIQAEKFLTDTNSEISIKYLKNAKYFSDDKESRDIYEITLTHVSRSYSFEFGQSINNSGFKLKQKSGRILDISVPSDKRELFIKNESHLRSYVRSYTKFNIIGSDKLIKPTTPTAYDVLACIEKYNPRTFEDFCGEFGYDTDSKKADKTYQEVVKQYLQICALYSKKELELLREIQ